MAFANILGNDRLMQNLSASIRKNRFSHFYLISGPEGSGKHTLADYLAGALLCTGEKKPCGECSACRKVLAKSHPDYITVDDPEHKTVAVKVIREARESIFVLPNESERKVYLFPQEMGIEGQNALLKVLEEPPSYGVFIILSNNPEKLLPTVRSRCTELNLSPLSARILRPGRRRRSGCSDPPQRRICRSSHGAAGKRFPAGTGSGCLCGSLCRKRCDGACPCDCPYGKVETRSGSAGFCSLDRSASGSAGLPQRHPCLHPVCARPVCSTQQ